MPDHDQLGPRGERLARERLSAAGYRIVETNYACRGGEVDIIAQEAGDAVFVEVRTRRTAAFGQPSRRSTMSTSACRPALWGNNF